MLPPCINRAGHSSRGKLSLDPQLSIGREQAKKAAELPGRAYSPVIFSDMAKEDDGKGRKSQRTELRALEENDWRPTSRNQSQGPIREHSLSI